MVFHCTRKVQITRITCSLKTDLGINNIHDKMSSIRIHKALINSVNALMSAPFSLTIIELIRDLVISRYYA